MQKNKNNHEKPKQRFSKKKFEESVRELFPTRKTAEVAEILGVETRQVSDFVHRVKSDEKSKEWTKKTATHRSEVAHENGKKGGRPRKNKKK